MKNKLAIFTITAVFALLLARMWQLAVDKNSFYERQAIANARKSQYILPVRALITDRNGELLAVNKLGFRALLAPHIKKSELEQITALLADCFGQNAQNISKKYSKRNSFYNQEFIEVMDFIPYESAQKCFFTLSLDEKIRLEASIKRLYPHGSLASHIIGYVGRANSSDMLDDEVAKLTKRVGKTGIERFYNERLAGKAGERVVQVNSTGLEQQTLEQSQAHNPPPLALTIDIRLQKYLDELFSDKAGAVVIMDVENGDILGAGSYPEYDLNMFVKGISNDEWQKLVNDLNHPFTNKLINGKYPPGSVVKMGVAMSFLASGKMDASTSFNCTGSFEFGGRKFRCHNIWGHGNMNVLSAIRSSCDDYFYKGALKVGIDAMSQTLAHLGFGSKSDVDLPLESPAILPSPTYKLNRWHKSWYQGETLNTSIGQGEFLVTPMQVAAYTAHLATGKYVRPRLSLEREVLRQNVLFASEAATLPILRTAMELVANDIRGTAQRHLAGIGVKIAAKTGTAQVVGISQKERARINEEDMQHFMRSHAWINAYAPANEPKVAIAIIVEHGMHGGSTAGPLLKDIVNKLIELGYIKAK